LRRAKDVEIVLIIAKTFWIFLDRKLRKFQTLRDLILSKLDRINLLKKLHQKTF
jgi:hypothetical protein